MTPVLGLVGDRNFSDLYVVLKGTVPPGTGYEAAKGMAVVFGYGAFITAVVNFLLIAAVIFVMVQAINRIHRKEEAAPPPPAPEPNAEVLLREIRDLLKERSR
ncbi:MAG: MscL family protein [Thiohalomonadaceae bacterium]